MSKQNVIRIFIIIILIIISGFLFQRQLKASNGLGNALMFLDIARKAYEEVHGPPTPDDIISDDNRDNNETPPSQDQNDYDSSNDSSNDVTTDDSSDQGSDTDSQDTPTTESN
jgi:hypothetical protein